MLTPRFSRARRLALWSASLVWLGLIAGAGVGGCQGPDTFLRKDDAGGGFGVGGTGPGGAGLGGFGVGGSGLGGFVGLGGGTGTGGAPLGSGGMGMGGRVGAGGALGTGGRGTGGTLVGTGGTPGMGGRDGGTPDAVAGTGGMVVGTGGAPGMDAGSDADGGVVGGTGPCAGLCANPVVLTGATSIPSTNQGNGATCYEASGTYQGGNCGNFAAPRTFSVNGALVPACSPEAGTGGGNFSIPARRNGGYCFQASPGEFAFAYFGLF